MSPDPSQTIDELRAYVGAENDAELARRLRIDKSTISSWRSRGRVPERYRRILGGADAHTYGTPPVGWGQHEVLAFRLALFRYTRARSDVALSGDYPTVLRTFSYEMGFFRLMGFAQRDLAKKKDEAEVELTTAFALVLHEYMNAGPESVELDRTLLAGHNPLEGERQEVL